MSEENPNIGEEGAGFREVFLQNASTLCEKIVSFEWD